MEGSGIQNQEFAATSQESPCLRTLQGFGAFYAGQTMLSLAEAAVFCRLYFCEGTILSSRRQEKFLVLRQGQRGGL